MGGVAGHAGLFAPVREVDSNRARADRVLRRTVRFRAEKNNPRVLDPRCDRDRESTWALGWDTAFGRAFQLGASLLACGSGSSRLHRHLLSGIEPESEVAISMLTNRVHPRRDNQKIRDFRPKIHDLIMDAPRRWLIRGAHRASRAFQRPSAGCI